MGRLPGWARAAYLGRGMVPQAALAPHRPSPITGPHQLHSGKNLLPMPAPSSARVWLSAKPLDNLWFSNINFLSLSKSIPWQGAGNFSLPIFPLSPAASAASTKRATNQAANTGGPRHAPQGREKAMPKRTRLDGCELHQTEEGYRVYCSTQLLGWACRPARGNRSRWDVRDAHGLKLPRSFPSLAGCVRYLRARSRLSAAQPLATSVPPGLTRHLG
jgi:hypothetical protein